MRRGRLGFAFLQRGSFYPGIFCLSLFFPLKFRILSEKPFREVSAEPAPNQPGSRWLAGREMLSGKQSYENLKDIYFPIYKASPQTEVQRCVASSDGAEL